MGRALSQTWQDHTLCIVDPAIENNGQTQFNSVTQTVQDFEADIIMLAVKPQILDNVLSDYTYLKGTNATVVSIMAGVSIDTLQKFFGSSTPIIRSMPNTPSMVGRGMTVCIGNKGVTEKQKHNADELLKTVGKVAWIDDEKLMHTVTGVSGSGPAYIFHLIEAMAYAGVKNGLAEELAMQLAHQTVTGSAELAYQSQEGADILRGRVTSPGGTTQAGLDVLMKDKEGLKELMADTVAAASKRSEELS